MPTLYSEHPAMFRSHPLGFILSLILVPAFGIGLLILLYWYLLNKGTKLTITENEILFERGLLSKERTEVAISSVRTIRVYQSFLNRVFGVGRVSIYTAGDSPEFVAVGIPNPNQVRDVVKLQQAS